VRRRRPPPRGAVVDLDSPLGSVRGVGPARARALAQAGYETVEDLLFHLPSRYEDRRAVATVAEALALPPGPRTLRGRLSGLRLFRLRRRMSLVRGLLTDATGSLPVVWFNRPYLAAQTVAGEDYLLHGAVREAKAGRELLNPSCERAAAALHGGRVAPVYPAIRGLGAPLLRRLFNAILDEMDPPLPDAVAEPLPPDLLARHGLPPLGEALRAVHRPGEGDDVDLLNRRRSPAHLRLLYGELLELQLRLAVLREREVRVPRSHRYRLDERLRQTLKDLLPFRLTAAQKRVLREIAADLESPWPMLRLLQGDVGSGKTIVAALALVIALENGLQGVFMAPTALLAEQHYASLRRLLGERYRIALLTGSAPDLAGARRAVARGDVQLAIGTHALLQEGVIFRRLGLAVVDEQQRFGVVERQILKAKGDRPDMLVMTATPIPRSLALCAYGDLEISVLDELPPGRSPVATEVVPASRRREVYARLRAALAAGARAYVVFPLIEGEGEEEAAAESIAGMGERVRTYLADWPSAVLDGRLPAAERERVMRAFQAGEVRLLVATTVIEVGVDVPEATWMVIESAERFGLAQLHQLRGRVGRGAGESRCVAIVSRSRRRQSSPESERRLAVFASTNDGFRIAQADLEIRGPGDLLGTRQAGLPAWRVADLAADLPWVERARDDAHALLPRLAEPALAGLRRRVESPAGRRHEPFGGG